jgi:short subunit dehydrogenase-like uncharacterized protein
MTTTTAKTYDLILFGVTGFTGKLAAEYLLNKNYDIQWAACARSEAKAKQILQDLAHKAGQEVPPVVVADLICNDDEAIGKLRTIVQSTRVVITAAGPFEKYGTTLHQLCAEEGVHYADITGETSFVRQMIEQHDDLARQTHALLVSHCGNDCIPQDLTVNEMHQYAQSHGCTLKSVVTYDEFPSLLIASGGTLTTALYQLSKPKTTSTSTTTTKSLEFDPLVKTKDGTKSEYTTKITHKSSSYVAEFQRKAGPWIMSPVMSNCVRRSNALLGYSSKFSYGDAMLQDPSWTTYVKETMFQGMVGVALYVPPLQPYLLPQPGEGPSRHDMEHGYLKCYGRGIMVDDNGKEIPLQSLFHFHHDTAYFMTAQMLVETGMLLVEKDKAGTTKNHGGVVTPAVAFGSDLTKRITTHMEADFEITEG